MISQAFKKTLLNNIRTTDVIYNYSKVLTYYEKSKNSSIGFLDFPNHEETMVTVEKVLCEELTLIDDKIKKDVHPYSKVFNLGRVEFINYIKENICVNLTHKVASLPVCDRFETTNWDIEVIQTLDTITIDPEKSFLENIHYNMIINNMIMKSILPCMMLGNNDFKEEYNDVFDSSYRFLEYIVNYIYTNGIDHDTMTDDERVPFLIIEELAKENDVELYMASKDDIKNIILILIFNSRHISHIYLNYMFMENTNLIRKITEDIYPNESDYINTSSNKNIGGKTSYN